MAVYTEVSFAEAAARFERLDTGALTALQPIASGIENTNYFADTAKGRYVLTLFERLTHAAAAFYYLRLMKHLAERGIPVPAACRRQRRAAAHLHGKAGGGGRAACAAPHLAPDAVHCAMVGRMLARMHLAAQPISARAAQSARPGLVGRDGAGDPALRRAEIALLDDELAFQQQLVTSRLPGPAAPAIHADLFRDNVMFEPAEDGATASAASSTSTSPASTRCCSTSACA